jgi:hypothetical protein
MNVRTLVRRYIGCEHSDTISAMPFFFREIYAHTSYKTFTAPYQVTLYIYIYIYIYIYSKIYDNLLIVVNTMNKLGIY